MNNRELAPIKLTNGGNRNLRSIGESNGVHCLYDLSMLVEPVSGLTKGEQHGYFTLLTTSGVPEDDAREKARKLKSFANGAPEADVQGHQNQEIVRRNLATNTIRAVLHDLAGLIGMRRTEGKSGTQTEKLGEVIPVGQEITVFSRT